MTADHKKVAVYLAEQRDDGWGDVPLAKIAAATGIPAERLWEEDNFTGILTDLNDMGYCIGPRGRSDPGAGCTMEQAVRVLNHWGY